MALLSLIVRLRQIYYLTKAARLFISISFLRTGKPRIEINLTPLYPSQILDSEKRLAVYAQSDPLTHFLTLTPIPGRFLLVHAHRSNFNPMPNFSKSTCDRGLIRPSTNQRGYQQALDDFAIASLLSRLQTLCDTEFDAAGMNVSQSELESLAAILIRELTLPRWEIY